MSALTHACTLRCAMPCTMRDDSHTVWNGYECSDTCMHGKVCHANVPCMRSVMQCGMDSLITSERRGRCATEIKRSMSALTHACTARCAMPCAMHDECHAVWNGQSHRKREERSYAGESDTAVWHCRDIGISKAHTRSTQNTEKRRDEETG